MDYEKDLLAKQGGLVDMKLVQADPEGQELVEQLGLMKKDYRESIDRQRKSHEQ